MDTFEHSVQRNCVDNIQGTIFRPKYGMNENEELLNEDENENETKNKFWEQERDQQPREREQWKSKV